MGIKPSTAFCHNFNSPLPFGHLSVPFPVRIWNINMSLTLSSLYPSIYPKSTLAGPYGVVIRPMGSHCSQSYHTAVWVGTHRACLEKKLIRECVYRCVCVFSQSESWSQSCNTKTNTLPHTFIIKIRFRDSTISILKVQPVSEVPSPMVGRLI